MMVAIVLDIARLDAELLVQLGEHAAA